MRSTVPSLSSALCLCQLLSTVSGKGGGAGVYGEQMGQSSLFYRPLGSSGRYWCVFYLSSVPGQTFPESGLGDGKWREGAREQVQRGASQSPEVSLLVVTKTTGSIQHQRTHHTRLCSFFSIYMAHVSDVLKAVEEIAGEGIPQQLGAPKDQSPSWPTLNK